MAMPIPNSGAELGAWMETTFNVAFSDQTARSMQHAALVLATEEDRRNEIRATMTSLTETFEEMCRNRDAMQQPTQSEFFTGQGHRLGE